MPAPTFTLTQAIPTCHDTGGSAAAETALDQGNVHVNDDCCRTYGVQVTLGGFAGSFAGTRKLDYEGTVDACANTSAGTKTYSGDAFRLCGGGGISGTHSGSGTVAGASFSGTGTGTASGSASGPYSVTITGTFTSPGNGSFSGTISGAISGTFMGTIAGGVATTTYTLSSGGAATGSATFTVGGGGTTFTFTGTISGTLGTVNGYWEVEWSSCSVGGIVARLRDADGDAELAEYANDRYALKSGRITLLNRRSIVCSHPCIDVGLSQRSLFQSQFINPLVICFTPDTGMARCLGGIRGSEYTMTLGGTSHAALDPFTGTGSPGGPSAIITAGTSGSATPTDFSLTGTLVRPGVGSVPGVTVDFTFGEAINFNGSALIVPCSQSSGPQASVRWENVFTAGAAATVTMSGPAAPAFGDYLEPDRPTLIRVIQWGAFIGVGGSLSHDYCDSDLVLTPSSPIVISFTSQVNVSGGLYLPVEFILTSSSSFSGTVTISQTGNQAYP